jgi:cell wall-associated NlpC family hydrolase
MPAEPDAIVVAARTWLGVPWRHQGRTRRGIDCAGLVVLVGRAMGLCDYDTSAYGRRPAGQGFVQHFRACMDGIGIPEARPGDVLVFADAAYPCHCGFLTVKHAQPHLLHAHALRRKVIEEPYAGEWPSKVKLAFRFRGLPHTS